MPDPYVSEAEVKEQLDIVGTTYADGEVTDAVAAASGAIDQACRRTFTSDVTGWTNRYSPTADTDDVEIDDLIDDDGILVTMSGVELERDVDFALLPLNASNRGRPYTSIKFLTSLPASTNDSSFDFVNWENRDFGQLSITGIWGWPAVPSNIKLAARIIAVKLITRMRTAPLGIIAVGDNQQIATYMAKYDPEVTLLLKGFARVRSQTIQLR